MKKGSVTNRIAMVLVTMVATMTLGASVFAKPANNSGGCCGEYDCHITWGGCNGPDDCDGADCCYSSCL